MRSVLYHRFLHLAFFKRKFIRFRLVACDEMILALINYFSLRLIYRLLAGLTFHGDLVVIKFNFAELAQMALLINFILKLAIEQSCLENT